MDLGAVANVKPTDTRAKAALETVERWMSEVVERCASRFRGRWRLCVRKDAPQQRKRDRVDGAVHMLAAARHIVRHRHSARTPPDARSDVPRLALTKTDLDAVRAEFAAALRGPSPAAKASRPPARPPARACAPREHKGHGVWAPSRVPNSTQNCSKTNVGPTGRHRLLELASRRRAARNATSQKRKKKIFFPAVVRKKTRDTLSKIFFAVLLASRLFFCFFFLFFFCQLQARCVAYAARSFPGRVFFLGCPGRDWPCSRASVCVCVCVWGGGEAAVSCRSHASGYRRRKSVARRKRARRCLALARGGSRARSADAHRSLASPSAAVATATSTIAYRHYRHYRDDHHAINAPRLPFVRSSSLFLVKSTGETRLRSVASSCRVGIGVVVVVVVVVVDPRSAAPAAWRTVRGRGEIGRRDCSGS